MQKLVITVTTDSSLSYPRNPYLTHCDDTKGVAEEYIRSMNAGATIVHTHGQYRSDPVIQPDGKQLSIPNVEGWRDITERVRAAGEPIVQFGLASMRLEQKLELWELLKPDMSSINFNSHDEYFQPDADYAPVPIYSVHPIPELRMYSSLAKKYGVKQEIECFNTGAYWAIGKIRGGDFWTEEGVREIDEDLLPEPLWLTLFFGWDGQGWTPPTAKGLQYMVDHLPPRANFSMSCMEPPNYWSMVAHTIAIGGHVRVGMEDCPFVDDGVYAKTNAELVEKAVRIAREVGREIASAAEAREIVGLPAAR
jgi:3-keto-5-aminohexanoate cleavage enzyme